MGEVRKKGNTIPEISLSSRANPVKRGSATISSPALAKWSLDGQDLPLSRTRSQSLQSPGRIASSQSLLSLQSPGRKASTQSHLSQQIFKVPDNAEAIANSLNKRIGEAHDSPRDFGEEQSRSRVKGGVLKTSSAPKLSIGGNDSTLRSAVGGNDSNLRGARNSVVMKRVRFIVQDNNNQPKEESRWLGFSFEVVEENNIWVQRWCTCFLIPLTYEMWAWPFRTALMSPSRSSTIFACDVLCDIFFVLDGISHLFIARKLSYLGSEPIVERTILATHYLLRVFPFELLPSIVYWFVSFKGAPLALWWAVGFLRMLPRMLRFKRFMNKMELDLDVDVRKLRFFKTALVIYMSSHWVGCIYFWLARLQGLQTHTWPAQFEHWWSSFERESHDHSLLYLASLYRGFCGTSPSSYLAAPQNAFEQVFSVAVVFLQLFVSAYLLGQILPSLKKHPLLELHEKKLSRFQAFADSRQLPTEIRSKVLQDYAFQYHKSVQYHGAGEVKLPHSLQVKVANRKYGPTIRKCCARDQLLYECDGTFLDSFMRVLHEVFLMPGEELIRKNDMVEQLFFVRNGAVEVMDGDHVQKVIRGDVDDMATVVGEVSFFVGIPQPKHVRAALDGDVQLLVLSKENAEELFEHYPEQQLVILRNITRGFQMDHEGNDLPDLMSVVEISASEQHQRKEIRRALKMRMDDSLIFYSKAVMDGDLEDVRSWLRRWGGDVNVRNYDGHTALGKAAARGHHTICLELLQNSADPSSRDRWGKTPLLYAIEARERHVMELLLESKANTSDQAYTGEIIRASALEDPEHLRLLLQCKVDPNVADYDRRTPLHVASARGLDKSVELLLSNAADPNARNRWGKSPLDTAIMAGHEVVAVLLGRFSKGYAAGQSAREMSGYAHKGEVMKLKLLHRYGAEASEQSFDNRTPLHAAASQARLATVVYLLGVGARVNVVDDWGNTALDDALLAGTLHHMLCAKYMQSLGAKVNALEGTEIGERKLAELQALDMDRVRAALHGLSGSAEDYGASVQETERNELIAHNASMALIEQHGRLRLSAKHLAGPFLSLARELDALQNAITAVLLALAAQLDHKANPASPLTLHFSQTFNTPKISPGETHPAVRELLRAAQSQSLTNLRQQDLGFHVLSVEQFICRLRTQVSNGVEGQNVSEEHSMDRGIDELYDEYLEVDEMHVASELEIISYSDNAKQFQRSLLRFVEVEKMHEALVEVFPRHNLSARTHSAPFARSHSAATSMSGEEGGGEEGEREAEEEGLRGVLEELGFIYVRGEVVSKIAEEARAHAPFSRSRLSASRCLSRSPTFRDLLIGKLANTQVRFVQTSGVLRWLSWRGVQTVCAHMVEQSVLEGQEIVHQGHRTQHLFIVKSGAFSIVRLQVGKHTDESQQEVGEVHSEAVLGALSFFTAEPSTVTVRALSMASVLSIAIQDLKAAVDGRTDVADKVVKELTRPNGVLYAGYEGLDGTAASEIKGRVRARLGCTMRVNAGLSLRVNAGLSFPPTPALPRMDGEEEWSLSARPRAPEGEEEEEEEAEEEEEEEALQKIRRGMQVIMRSFAIFSFGSKTAHRDVIKPTLPHLGEIGLGFLRGVDVLRSETLSEDDWFSLWMEFMDGDAPLVRASQTMRRSGRSSLMVPRLPRGMDLLQHTEQEEDSLCAMKGPSVPADVEREPRRVHDRVKPPWWDAVKVWLGLNKAYESLMSSLPEERYAQAWTLAVGDVDADALHSQQVCDFVTQLLKSEPWASRNVELWAVQVVNNLFGNDERGFRLVMLADVLEAFKEQAPAHTTAQSIWLEHCWLLNPKGFLVRAWMVLMELVAIYIFVLLPLRMAFDDMSQRDGEGARTAASIATMIFSDVLVAMHPLVTFNVGIVNEKSLWITDRQQIARTYLQRWFLIDFIAALPLDWMVWANGVPEPQTILWRLPKLLFVHVVWPGSSMGGIKEPKNRSKMMAIMILAPLHVAACVWSALAHVENSWYRAEFSEDWLEGIREKGNVRYYFVSLHWVTQTVSSTGNVNVWPGNTMEVITTIVLLVVGMTSYRLITGEISSRVMSADEEILKLREELGAVQRFISGINIPDNDALALQIREHFHSSKAAGQADLQDIYDTVSYNLQREISWFLFADFLSSIDVFFGVNEAFLKRISVVLRETSFAPEEYFFRAGEVSHAMYFVIQGSAQRAFEGQITNGGKDQDARKITKGSCCGFVSFIFGTRHGSSVQAGNSGCVCLKLGRKQYLQILKLYPKEGDVISQNALKKFDEDVAKQRSQSNKSSVAAHEVERNTEVLMHLKSTQPINLADAADPESGKLCDDATDICSSNVSDGFDQQMGKGTMLRINGLREQLRWERMEKMLLAAADGDEEKIVYSLERFVEVNDCNEERRTSLHIAAAAGQTGVVKLLLEYKASVEAVDIFGNTPLHDALREERHDIVELLREAYPGLRVNIAGERAAMELCAAAASGDERKLDYILNKGVSVNVRDYDCRTALHLASAEGHHHLVEKLLERKADVGIKDRMHRTALEDAISSGATMVQSLLLKAGCRIVSKDTAERLCEMGSQGDVQGLATFVQNGVDINICDSMKRCALHTAALHGKVVVLEYLLNLTPQVNLEAADIGGKTALEHATRLEQKVAAFMIEEHQEARRVARRDRERRRSVLVRHISHRSLVEDEIQQEIANSQEKLDEESLVSILAGAELLLLPHLAELEQKCKPLAPLLLRYEEQQRLTHHGSENSVMNPSPNQNECTRLGSGPIERPEDVALGRRRSEAAAHGMLSSVPPLVSGASELGTLLLDFVTECHAAVQEFPLLPEHSSGSFRIATVELRNAQARVLGTIRMSIIMAQKLRDMLA